MFKKKKRLDGGAVGFVEFDMQLFHQNRFTVQLEIKIKTKQNQQRHHLIFYFF
jgi:hypothetical protein